MQVLSPYLSAIEVLHNTQSHIRETEATVATVDPPSAAAAAEAGAGARASARPGVAPRGRAPVGSPGVIVEVEGELVAQDAVVMMIRAGFTQEVPPLSFTSCTYIHTLTHACTGY
jgi:hypothetical protein